MITEFPNISATEVVLIRVDNNTGIVLDVDYKMHVNPNQIKYSIFNSIEPAKKYIAESKFKHRNIEFVIYDHLNNVIYKEISE